MHSKLKRHLYLMRHGATNSDGRVLNDFNKPLSRRGIQEVIDCSELFREKMYPKPDCVLCSTALRTRQTLELMQPIFPETVVSFRETLYLAPLSRLTDMLRELDNIFQSVMVIGHNPGLENLIEWLTKSKIKRRLTSADCAVVQVNKSDWHGLDRYDGILIDLLRMPS